MGDAVSAPSGSPGSVGPLALVPASERDIDAVFEVYAACTQALLARGIRQWDPGYPNRATASDAVARGDLFLLVDERNESLVGSGAAGAAGGEALRGIHALGSVILNGVEAPEYAGISWQEPDPALVIHTLVIDPRRQGGGLGRAAMACCEAFGRQRGFACVRLDAYPGNPAAITLYERLGYAHRGEVHFGWKPPGHERYAVYEKRL
jgi:ribosomal protein S18 acetylase RimI-like enzyme